VTLSEQELDELLAASKKRHRIFGDCSVRFLCNDALPYSRAILSGGGIGSPYHARLVNRKPRLRPGIEFQPESKWFLNKDVAGGGAIYDWGVYDLTMLFDVLRPVAAHVLSAWLATPKTAVDPVDAPITIETHAGATIKLELASGDTVMLDFERGFGMHGEFQALLNVDGSEGGLSWEWCPPFDEEDKIKVTHWVDVDGKLDKRIKPFPAISWDDVHSRPLVAFLDLVAGRDSVITTLDRLKFNHLVLMAIYQCAENGSSVEVKLGT
jgi:predicted dehydrogenase